MNYLMNAWYLAAWNREVPADKLLARTLLGQRVVFYRDAQGQARALQDRCPHRFVPLSLGKVCAGQVECGYHGLRFGADGRCSHNPHGDGRVPRAAAVRAYPVVERYTGLWIWMGDPDRADSEVIPDFNQSMDPDKRVVGQGYLHVKANYMLEVDNILDLSHIQYLHGSNVGSEAVAAAETAIEQDGDVVHSKRLTRNERLNPVLEQQYRLPPGQPVDRWLDTRWSAPATMELWVGAAAVGSPDPRSVGKRQPYAHIFTPETERTTHYFFATSYPTRMGEEAVRRAAADIEFLRQPFALEDQPMLEAQQAEMGDAEFWSLKPVLLAGDAPAVRARRVLDGLIQAEQQAQAVGTPST
jgi:phenylpropionate dioxygenase-like ring-hydroxylating dioxygenase large terminal subunit